MPPADASIPTARTTRLREAWFLTSELESERASSFRQERWCRIFLDAGATLRIFNLRGAFDHSDAVCANAEELAVFRREGLARYRGPQASVREGMAVRLLRRLKHMLLADIYLPNVIKLYRRLDELLSARNEPVVLMASSPPFSVAVVGALIKRRHRSKVVFAVDMRDAWALHNALGGIRPIKRAIERRVLRRADHVTTVSKGLADEFRQWYGVEVGVMYNVATHYLDVPPADRIDLRQVSPEIEPQRLTLVYTGSTPEHHYDLAAIVGAVARLRQERPALAARLQLVFVGACDEARREAQARGLGAPEIVFVPHLPHATARSVQASASALVFLAHHGPNNMGVVSTKLFEYLCLGQPVLPFDLCEGSDVDLLLRRYCGTSVNAHGETAIAALLARVAEHGVEVLPQLKEVQRVCELLEDYRNHAETLLAS
jgi:glycosyltransferase involved in cell wall biosynthesis